MLPERSNANSVQLRRGNGAAADGDFVNAHGWLYRLRCAGHDRKYAAVRRALEKIGVKFDAIITGYCCTVEQIKLTAEFIRSFSDTDTLVIVDPVLGDHEALYTGFTDAHVDAMRELCSLADLITPNRTEAALLAGLSFSSADETLLYAQQVKDAVITSVGSGSRIGYLARLDGRVTLVQKEAVDMTVHGAGDVFTSALSGELLSGQAPQTALLRAADFCDSCIHETAKRQPGHWYGLAFEPVLKGNRV